MWEAGVAGGNAAILDQGTGEGGGFIEQTQKTDAFTLIKEKLPLTVFGRGAIDLLKRGRHIHIDRVVDARDVSHGRFEGGARGGQLMDRRVVGSFMLRHGNSRHSLFGTGVRLC